MKEYLGENLKRFLEDRLKIFFRIHWAISVGNSGNILKQSLKEFLKISFEEFMRDFRRMPSVHSPEIPHEVVGSIIGLILVEILGEFFLEFYRMNFRKNTWTNSMRISYKKLWRTLGIESTLLPGGIFERNPGMPKITSEAISGVSFEGFPEDIFPKLSRRNFGRILGKTTLIYIFLEQSMMEFTEA